MKANELARYYFICILPSYTALYIILHQIMNIDTLSSYLISSLLGGTLNLLLYKKMKVF